jgi:nitroreductase
MQPIIEALNWRYATKQYDQSKKLTETQLNMLMEAVRLAPSSFGLQPWKAFVVHSADVRTKLRAAAWNQSPITEASHFVVFAVPTNLGDDDVSHFIETVAAVRGVPVESLKEYADMIRGAITRLTPEARVQWAARQAYLALGVLLSTAAVEKIDATPMEGFDPKQFDEILGLTDKNYTSVVVATLGFRSSEDAYAHLAKVRFPKEEIIVDVA